jgi:hypothetical protein
MAETTPGGNTSLDPEEEAGAEESEEAEEAEEVEEAEEAEEAAAEGLLAWLVGSTVVV